MKIGLLTGLALLAVQDASPAPPQSFCQRLAPQLGMTPIQRGRSGQATGEWRVNQVGGVKSALFGGSAMASFSVQPVGVLTEQAEADRLQKMCQQEKKSIVCRVEGPAKLVIGANKGNAAVEARAGERAEVEMRGTSIYCRDPAAVRAG